MPVTIDWGTKLISVPLSYLDFISGTLYELDTDQFRNDLNSLQAGVGNRSAPGMAHLDTHTHNTEVTVAGVTYARFIEIINGYTVVFEDGTYAVKLVGSNNNIFDEGILVRNQVSIIPTNSAGLINLGSIIGGFEPEVYFDATAGNMGTGLDDGTRINPVSTVDAALTIVAARMKSGVRIIEGTFLLDRAVDNMVFIGAADPATSILDFGGFSATRCQVEHCQVQGDANNERVVFAKCIVDALTNVHGLFEACYLMDHGLDTGADSVTYDNCRSSVPGSAMPIVDANNRTGDIETRAYAGGFAFTNLTSATTNVSVDFNSGHLQLNASCTDVNGMVVRGVGKMTDNSSIAAAKIDTDGLTTGSVIAKILSLVKAILGLV